jgi:hypothetical protein
MPLDETNLNTCRLSDANVERICYQGNGGSKRKRGRQTSPQSAMGDPAGRQRRLCRRHGETCWRSTRSRVIPIAPSCRRIMRRSFNHNGPWSDAGLDLDDSTPQIAASPLSVIRSQYVSGASNRDQVHVTSSLLNESPIRVGEQSSRPFYSGDITFRAEYIDTANHALPCDFLKAASGKESTVIP